MYVSSVRLDLDLHPLFGRGVRAYNVGLDPKICFG